MSVLTEPPVSNGASVAALQAKAHGRTRFRDPRWQGHSDWIMLVMLLHLANQPAPAPRFSRHVVREKDVPIGMAGRIMEAVCDEFGLSPAMLRSERRARRIARPRQIAMALMAEYTYMSLPQIARYVGRGCHTTVMHAIKAVEKFEDKDPKHAEAMSRIVRRLGV